MYTTFSGIIRQFEFVPGLINKLQSVMPLLMEELQISDLYYVGKNNTMHAVRNSDQLLWNDDLFTSNDMEEVRRKSPAFYETVKQMEFETLCILRIGYGMETNGYLICAEARNRRIWQEAECAILYFLAKMIAASIRIDGEKLE